MPGKSPWGRGSGSSGSGGGNRPPGGGNRPPFGGGKKPGGSEPIDIDQILRSSHAKVRNVLGGGASGPQEQKRLITWGVLALAVLWLASGIYRVNSDELGVVLRFGEYHRTTTSGLNYHLPFPVEKVLIPSVTSVNKVEIGYRGNAEENPNVRTARFAGNAGSAPQNREGLMLTGDRNIVDIDFEVQWKIDATSPEKFLFNMRDPAGSVRAVGESAMREVIGRNKLDDVLTTAQTAIAEDTRAIMQQIFDSYDAGIEIIAVNLSRPDVPREVIDEFQDVKRAEQDKETAESVAEGYRNEILPKAKGEAAQMLQQASAYKAQVVADAEGNASRFSQIYKEYAQAKDVTKRRMYLETMEHVLRGMPKVIVDQQQGTGGGVVQMLPIPQMPARNPATPATPTVLPAAQ